MFKMEARYCNYYKIENGREICGLAKTSLKSHCRKCMHFKSYLYNPADETNEDEAIIFAPDKFEEFKYMPKSGRGGYKLRVSSKERSVSITKSAADALNDPDYVKIYINCHDLQIAVKKSAKDSLHAIKVGKYHGYRTLYCSCLARELSKYGAIATGEYDSVNDVIIFTFRDNHP